MKKLTILAVAALVLFVIAAGYASVTNFGAIHIRDANPTGVPALKVNQQGAGVIFQADDGGTPVARIPNGGGVDIVVGDLQFGNGETINNTTDGFIGYTGGQLWSTTTITAANATTYTVSAYTVYNMDSASAVTITLAACTEGGPVIIAGDDANNITIADTNIRTSDGAAAVVGQYDVWFAICVDSEWLEIANITNQ